MAPTNILHDHQLELQIARAAVKAAAGAKTAAEAKVDSVKAAADAASAQSQRRKDALQQQVLESRRELQGAKTAAWFAEAKANAKANDLQDQLRRMRQSRDFCFEYWYTLEAKEQEYEMTIREAMIKEQEYERTIREAKQAYESTIREANAHFKSATQEWIAASLDALRYCRTVVQENGMLVQSEAAHVLRVQALSQDVERREVTTYGSLLWDSLMRSMPGDGKATVTRYQGLGKAKQ